MNRWLMQIRLKHKIGWPAYVSSDKIGNERTRPGAQNGHDEKWDNMEHTLMPHYTREDKDRFCRKWNQQKFQNERKSNALVSILS